MPLNKGYSSKSIGKIALKAGKPSKKAGKPSKVSKRKRA